MNYKGKHILVLGLGRSGVAAARLLQQAGAMVTVADSGMSDLLEERASTLRSEGITVHLSTATERDFSFYERAILSPGIETTTPLVVHVVAQGIPIVGELELAYGFCKCPIVAITGSNGKTTTTELTTAALKSTGLSVVACGNIGVPFSEVVLQSVSLDVIVIEVSSFQLESTDQFHATIAVWLNLSPNHLDRYAGMAEYRAAKLRIFRHQQPSDTVITPSDFNDEGLPERVAKRLTFSSKNLSPQSTAAAKSFVAPVLAPSSIDYTLSCCAPLTPCSSSAAATLKIGSNEEKADFYYHNDTIFYQGNPLFEMSQTQLRGAHNAENMMAALAVGVTLHLAPETMVEALCHYRALPHRCEIVAEEEGVTWINDSKATTPDAMEKAIESIKKSHPIILIAGGKNKGSSFYPLLPLIKERVKAAILLGEMRHSIATAWQGVSCHQVESMEEAVATAHSLALPNDVILLSPGTSSYDMFTDYEKRGECFKTCLQILLKQRITASLRCSKLHV